MRAIVVDSATKRPRGVDPGAPPMLEWLPIASLVVDDDYQRELGPGNWAAIRRIAAGFRWSRFSPVFVAPVEGGLFAIIDGQHRTHAAALCGFGKVPCQIVQMSRAEQAASFAAVNGLVTKVTLWNIYKAALVAGETWAVACDDCVTTAGCRLMHQNATTALKQPGEIYAIGLIRRHVAAGHAAMVTATLKGMRGSEFGKTAEAYSNEILKPLLAAVAERPWLVPVDLAPFLDRFDIYAAIDRAEEFVRTKRRQGFADVSRFDVASVEIGEGLDKAFPQRVALPRAVS